MKNYKDRKKFFDIKSFLNYKDRQKFFDIKKSQQNLIILVTMKFKYASHIQPKLSQTQ